MGFAKISYLSVEETAMNKLKLWREERILQLEGISKGQAEEGCPPIDLYLYDSEIITGIVQSVETHTGGIKMKCLEDDMPYMIDIHITLVERIISPSLEFLKEDSDELQRHY